MLALLSLLPQLLALGEQLGPEILSGFQTALSLIGSSTAITPAQQASIDAALDASHAALQAA